MRKNKANSNKYVRVDTFAGKRILKVKDLLGGAGKQIFLPDVGWTENYYSNYVPDTYRTQKKIQRFFEQKEIMAEYLQDGIDTLFDIDEKLEGIVYEKTPTDELGDDEMELWKAVWLYEDIVMDDVPSVKQKRDYVANKLINLKHVWIDLPGISEYQKQLPEIILTHDYDLHELVNICSQLSIEQLYILGW